MKCQFKWSPCTKDWSKLDAPMVHVERCHCFRCTCNDVTELVSGVAVKPTNRASILPDDSAERKKFPIGTGVLDYFPDAICAIAEVSWHGNQQHNPGEPLHWARGKSMDQEDTMERHYLQRGTRDKDGLRHTAKMAWRALAILQLEIEGEQKSQT